MQNHRRVQLAIAVGGAAGAYARILVDQVVGRRAAAGRGRRSLSMWPAASCWATSRCACWSGCRVHVPPAAARHRLLRRVHDVLDGAARAARNAPPRRCGDGARLCAGVHRLRLRSAHGGCVDRPARGGDRMSIAAWAWPVIAVAGAVGALCRFTLDGAVEARSPYRFPFGTLCVNLLGAAILGVLLRPGRGRQHLPADRLCRHRHVHHLLDARPRDRAAAGGWVAPAACANLLGSMGLGIVFVTLGWLLGRAL